MMSSSPQSIISIQGVLGFVVSAKLFAFSSLGARGGHDRKGVDLHVFPRHVFQGKEAKRSLDKDLRYLFVRINLSIFSAICVNSIQFEYTSASLVYRAGT